MCCCEDPGPPLILDHSDPCAPPDMSKLQMEFTLLKERLAQLEDGWTNGGFEWLDGMLVQALTAGDWLLMDNVNFCR